jgi:hypothetical protein
LKQHADVNADRRRQHGVYYAAENNDLEIVKALIAAGADAMPRTATGSRRSHSPPSTAAPITAALLVASANPNGPRRRAKRC